MNQHETQSTQGFQLPRDRYSEEEQKEFDTYEEAYKKAFIKRLSWPGMYAIVRDAWKYAQQDAAMVKRVQEDTRERYKKIFG